LPRGLRLGDAEERHLLALVHAPQHFGVVEVAQAQPHDAGLEAVRRLHEHHLRPVGTQPRPTHAAAGRAATCPRLTPSARATCGPTAALTAGDLARAASGSASRSTRHPVATATLPHAPYAAGKARVASETPAAAAPRRVGGEARI